MLRAIKYVARSVAKTEGRTSNHGAGLATLCVNGFDMMSFRSVT